MNEPKWITARILSQRECRAKKLPEVDGLIDVVYSGGREHDRFSRALVPFAQNKVFAENVPDLLETTERLEFRTPEQHRLADDTVHARHEKCGADRRCDEGT